MVPGLLARRGFLFSICFTCSGAHRTDVGVHGVVTSDAPVETFPAQLEDQGYIFARKLACGLHGCAFLAQQGKKTKAKMVVIKVSDESQSAESEERLLSMECGHMKWLRYEACRHGPDMLALHERYIPSCIDDGKLDDGKSYLVMPFAGPTQIKKLYRPDAEFIKRFSDSELRSMFAQMVAAVSSLHMMGIWHTDLNSGNLMLDGSNIALIDYGLVVRNTSLDPRSLDGYSRDANAVFRWGSIMARCPKEAQWSGKWWQEAPVLALTAAQRAAEKCYIEKWGVDEDFLAALREMFNASAHKTEGNQHVQGLLGTKFVESNLPANSPIYRLDGTKDCANWKAQKLAQEMPTLGAEDPLALEASTSTSSLMSVQANGEGQVLAEDVDN